VKDEKGDGQYYRQQAWYSHASAQECADYASMATDPNVRDAWKRVAECHQNLATALEHLASATDKIESEKNSN
jgi:hypothetical protein